MVKERGKQAEGRGIAKKGEQTGESREEIRKGERKKGERKAKRVQERRKSRERGARKTVFSEEDRGEKTVVLPCWMTTASSLSFISALSTILSSTVLSVMNLNTWTCFF